jgi:hypothetical protein
MHRTRFGSVVIDCHDFEAGIAFWAAALGVDRTGCLGRTTTHP